MSDSIGPEMPTPPAPPLPEPPAPPAPPLIVPLLISVPIVPELAIRHRQLRRESFHRSWVYLRDNADESIGPAQRVTHDAKKVTRDQSRVMGPRKTSHSYFRRHQPLSFPAPSAPFGFAGPRDPRLPLEFRTRFVASPRARPAGGKAAWAHLYAAYSSRSLTQLIAMGKPSSCRPSAVRSR